VWSQTPSGSRVTGAREPGHGRADGREVEGGGRRMHGGETRRTAVSGGQAAGDSGRGMGGAVRRVEADVP
jgi:hypothetical protein